MKKLFASVAVLFMFSGFSGAADAAVLLIQYDFEGMAEGPVVAGDTVPDAALGDGAQDGTIAVATSPGAIKADPFSDPFRGKVFQTHSLFPASQQSGNNGSWINAAAAVDPSLTEISLTVWVHNNAEKSYSEIVAVGGEGTSLSTRPGDLGNGNPFAFARGDGGPRIGGNTQIGYGPSIPGLANDQAGWLANNRWRHLAMTASLITGEVKLYVDGVLDATTSTVNSALFSSGDLGVGGRYDTDGSGTNVWMGFVDDVRIYSGVLTDAEILNLANNIPEPSTVWMAVLGCLGLAAARRRR